MMGNLGDLSPGGSVAVSPSTVLLCTAKAGRSTRTSANVLPTDWHTCRPDLYKCPKLRSHASTKVPSPGRRERSLRCTTTTIQKAAVATGHGHVYNLEFGWKYDTDHHASIAGALDIAGLGAGLQFDMRHFDSGRALYTLVIGRNAPGIERCCNDCNIWRNTRACA